MRRRGVAGGRSSPVNHPIVAGANLPPRSNRLWGGPLFDQARARLQRQPPLSIGAGLRAALVTSGIIETTISVGGGSANDEQSTSPGGPEPSPPFVQDESRVGNYVLTSPSLPISHDERAADEVNEQESTSVTISIHDYDGASVRSIVSETPYSMPRPVPRRQRPITLSQGRDIQSLVNPRVQFLESNLPRSDSPIQYCAELPLNPDEIDQNMVEDICHSVLELEKSLPGSDLTSAHPPKPTITDVEAEISRKILIIGSDYKRGVRRTFTISSTITLESPSSDKQQLRESFQLRGYSVHSMVNNHFDRDEALARVSSFLSTANCRDVRAIVFTGHAARTDGQDRPALVPPNCPDAELAIPADLWESTIRKNTQPGVIVLSIFASCFSGDFMKQEIDLKDLNQDTSNTVLDSASNPGPILVTFTSAAPDQLSYESSIETDRPWRVSDHFLYALDMTARSPDVRDWQGFINTMESHFRRAREVGASFDSTRTPEEWQRDSPQDPSYRASNVVALPTLFPHFQNAPVG
ncbi:hypothetical protein FS749_003003 [Ceratobasidium sp. UAMH 11750]|nr:hypothetical protein FS749_003003 [Ceratobasidium sp. UAMH 11750]